MMPLTGVYHNRAGLETGFHKKENAPEGGFTVDQTANLV